MYFLTLRKQCSNRQHICWYLLKQNMNQLLFLMLRNKYRYWMAAWVYLTQSKNFEATISQFEYKKNIKVMERCVKNMFQLISKYLRQQENRPTISNCCLILWRPFLQLLLNQSVLNTTERSKYCSSLSLKNILEERLILILVVSAFTIFSK